MSSRRRTVITTLVLPLLALLASLVPVGPTPVSAATGGRGIPLAVVLCTFSDRAQQPRTPAQYQQLFTGSGSNTMNDFFSAQSYGTRSLAGTRVFGWYPIGMTEKAYNGLGQAGRETKAQRCVDAAAGVDFSGYAGVVTITNTEGDYFGGQFPLTLNGVRRTVSVSVLWGAADVSTAVQEIAHGLGLRAHSWSTRTPGVAATCAQGECEYGDTYDVMSAATPASFAGTWGPSGPGFNAANREWFGWLPAARVRALPLVGCASTCTTTVRLGDLNTLSAPGALLLKIPVPAEPGHWLTVEYRRNAGWDAGLPADAVYVHEVRANGLSYLVKRSDGRADYAPGTTFSTDLPTPVRVAVAAGPDPRSVDVTVTRTLRAERWTRVATDLRQPVSGGLGLFGRFAGTDDVAGYAGLPDVWRTVAAAPQQELAVNDRFLAVKDPGTSEVLRTDGDSWVRIGGPAGRLYAGAQSLYATTPGTGDLMRYDGIPYQWTRIGGPGRQFVVNETGLFALTSDGAAVMRFTGTPGSWQRIGGAALSLVTTGRQLFAVQAGTGDVLRWDGAVDAWTRVGGPAAELAGTRDALYALTPSRDGVWRSTGTAGSWTQVGGAASRLAAHGGSHLAALSPDGTRTMLLHR